MEFLKVHIKIKRFLTKLNDFSPKFKGIRDGNNNCVSKEGILIIDLPSKHTK